MSAINALRIKAPLMINKSNTSYEGEKPKSSEQKQANQRNELQSSDNLFKERGKIRNRHSQANNSLHKGKY